MRNSIFFIAMLCISSTVWSAPNINGNYDSTVYFFSKTVLGPAGACQSSPSSRFDFQVTKVRLNKKTGKVTGILTYDGASSGRRLAGKLTENTFYLKYRLVDSSFDYRYKYVFSKITATTAKIREVGRTYYVNTSNGCKYDYRGTAGRY